MYMYIFTKERAGPMKSIANPMNGSHYWPLQEFDQANNRTQVSDLSPEIGRVTLAGLIKRSRSLPPDGANNKHSRNANISTPKPIAKFANITVPETKYS